MKKIFVAATVTALAVIGSVAFTALASAQAPQDASASVAGAKAITIWRDPGCGCCDTYADYLEMKVDSLSKHASQMGGRAADRQERMRRWASRSAETTGIPFAEAFRRQNLDIGSMDWQYLNT